MDAFVVGEEVENFFELMTSLPSAIFFSPSPRTKPIGTAGPLAAEREKVNLVH